MELLKKDEPIPENKTIKATGSDDEMTQDKKEHNKEECQICQDNMWIKVMHLFA